MRALKSMERAVILVRVVMEAMIYEAVNAPFSRVADDCDA